uniref:HDIG domain-containing protein n=1 Tax=candidate division WOR-3 bacterium TaxID=2052148 RepID=A0A7C3N5I9_UNCW3
MHILHTIKNKIKIYYFDIILVLILVIFFNLFYPSTFSKIPQLKKGDISPKDIIAPFTFDIIKNSDILRKEKEKAYDNTPPVIVYDENRNVEILNNFYSFKNLVDSLNKNVWKNELKRKVLKDSIKNLSDDLVNILFSEQSKNVLSFVENSLKYTLDVGLIGDKSVIPFGKDRKVSLKRGNREILKNDNEIFDLDEANEHLKKEIIKKYSGNSYLLKYGLEMFQYFLKPNIFFDRDETSFRREKAKNEVSEKVGIVLKGEIIVKANQVVDQTVEDKIYSLNRFLKGEDNFKNKILNAIYKNLIFIITFILYIIFINTQFPKLNLKKRDKLFVLLLYLINLGIFGFFYELPNIEYIVPLILTSILLSLLYSKTFSLITLLFILTSLILYSGMRLYGLLAVLVSSIYSIFFIKDENLKKNFFGIVFKISFINLSLSFFIELYRESTLSNIFVAMLYSFITPVLSFVIMMFTIKYIENILQRLTNVTLFELSDLNNELLKELSEKTSGTYNHSIIVSRLAEKIAQSIDADILLVRVGSYYHDIGKMQKPEYFIENQFKGTNPHENLPYEISAEIIIEHVKNGLKLAQKYKLPEKVQRFIITHHGTTNVGYFYEKAKESNKPFNKELFRYPGPLPSSKEETIVMLSDSIEAAVRSINITDDDSLKEIIEKIINKRMEEKQFNESNITLKDLEKIKEISFEFFKGIYHPRIDYVTKK